MLKTATVFIADLINNFFIVASKREIFFVLWSNKNPISIKTNKIISRNVTLTQPVLLLCQPQKVGWRQWQKVFFLISPSRFSSSHSENEWIWACMWEWISLNIYQAGQPWSVWGVFTHRHKTNWEVVGKIERKDVARGWLGSCATEHKKREKEKAFDKSSRNFIKFHPPSFCIILRCESPKPSKTTVKRSFRNFNMQFPAPPTASSGKSACETFTTFIVS